MGLGNGKMILEVEAWNKEARNAGEKLEIHVTSFELRKGLWGQT